MPLRLLIPLLAIILLFGACKREVIPMDEIDLGKAYYPLAIGSYIEYAVDSIVYNNFTKDTDRVKLEFRDHVTDEFLDNQGRPTRIIDRAIRYQPGDAWESHQTYYATITNYRAEVVDNNLRFIKLIFPIRANTSWKGNVFIPAASTGLDEIKWYHNWDYRYKNINTPFTTGFMSVDSSVEISYSRLTNDSTSTKDYNDFTNYKEVYARNIGLIYRELTHWEYQPTDEFRNGFTVILRAKKYY